MEQKKQNSIHKAWSTLDEIHTRFSYAADLIYTTAECMGKSDLSADSYETSLLGIFSFVDSINADLEETINDLKFAMDESNAETKESKPANIQDQKQVKENVTWKEQKCPTGWN